MGVKQCNTRAMAGLFQPSITRLTAFAAMDHSSPPFL